jgi:RNA polymerase sigma factor (sigma-70 family)
MTGPDQPASLEDVWRGEAPYVVAALLRRHGDLGDCEDAAQEAAAAAVAQWPTLGVPANPRGWLITVAGRRLVDRLRAREARERREVVAALQQPGDAHLAAAADEAPAGADDDVLRLMFLCCHPCLTPASQVALTLRAVAGLSVEQVAATWLVSAATMAQRLSRARSSLREAGARFTMPGPAELPGRVAAVLHACYLMFNEGYLRTAADTLGDGELAEEAIGLTRRLRGMLPGHAEVAGALALMLLTHARRRARTTPDGDLVPLAEQDRTLWDPDLTAEGLAIVEEVLPRGRVGPFQLQAAIAAVHAEAGTAAETDWLQISVLYRMLHQLAPSPAVTLNRSVAEAMAFGPRQGLVLLEPLLEDRALQTHHRLHAVQAHLLELASESDAAASSYRRAAALATSRPEQRYLNARLRRLEAGTAG